MIRRIQGLGFAAIALMTVSMIFGFYHGDFWGDVRAITRTPWGIVSLVDVYVGLVLFSAWVVSRERTRWKGLAWAGMVLLAGNLVAALYVAAAARASGGDLRRFWMGEGYGEEERSDV